jgi:hypothetical protein
MVKKKAKKGLIGGEVRLPHRIPSIWHKIDDLMKRKQDIPDDEIEFVGKFVERGDKILDEFGRWVIVNRKLHSGHAKKWQDVKEYNQSYRLAKVM